MALLSHHLWDTALSRHCPGLSHVIKELSSAFYPHPTLNPTPKARYNVHMQERKCYNCRTPVEDDRIRCEDCVGVEIRGTSTLVIYDKI